MNCKNSIVKKVPKVPKVPKVSKVKAIHPVPLSDFGFRISELKNKSQFPIPNSGKGEGFLAEKSLKVSFTEFTLERSEGFEDRL